MKGLWRWPDDNDRKSAIQRLKEPHTLSILSLLKKSGTEGLSNAQIDSLLQTDSQWLIFWDIRELVALGLIKYEVQPFGEPAKYLITDKGISVLEEIQRR